MAQRNILTYGHPTLKRPAAQVAEVDDGVRALVQDLFETMAAARGIGLAAPQVGDSRRVIVVDPTPMSPEGARPLALINPEIVAYAGSVVFEEGCLSVPGAYADVRRPETVRVRFVDPQGEEHTDAFDGFMARVVQHEMDHLEGVLFVDRLSAMRRTLLMRKLRGIKAQPQADRPAL
jgi:peptide deformylase